MGFVESNTRTFEAGAAIGRHLRVKLTSGTLAVAGATDTEEVGTMNEASFAAGEVKAVRLRSAMGTAEMVAAGSITVGSEIFTAASGKVSTTQATNAVRVGVALTAAGADGDVIEVLRD